MLNVFFFSLEKLSGEQEEAIHPHRRQPQRPDLMDGPLDVDLRDRVEGTLLMSFLEQLKDPEIITEQ